MFKEIIKRQQSINSILRYNKVTDEDKQKLKQYQKLETSIHYGNKLLIFASLFLVYKKGFFDKRSTFLTREIALCSGLLGYNYLVEYQTNQYVWSQVKPIIRKYALMKEREFYELKQVEKKDTIQSIYE